MKKTKLLIFTALAAVLLMSSMAIPAFATSVPPFTLQGSVNQLIYVMHAGTTFNGTISTTGPVRFWTSDPNGFEIVNLGIIDTTTTFNFTAPLNGTYIFNFEEDLGNSIQVTFSYVTNHPISSVNNSPGFSDVYFLITVIIAIVGSILIVFIIRRKNKSPPSKARNTSPTNPASPNPPSSI